MSRKILLGVTGSVAAVLTGKMIRALKELGEVKVVFTESGYYFIKANEKARSEFINVLDDQDIYRDSSEWPPTYDVGDTVPHIMLRDWADVILAAPLSANTMAKICYGLCDNLLTSVVRAWDHNKPMIAAPAMNTKMWFNHPTQAHVREMTNQGWHIINPVEKELACGDKGMGAMAPIEDVVGFVSRRINLTYSDAS